MPLPIVWHPAYEVDIGPHVFPTRKYRLVRDRLLAERTISNADLVEPAPASDDQVALVHTPDYVRKIRMGTLSPEEQLVLEVPFSPALREACWTCAGGSTLAGRLALEQGIAVHLGGGFHHAFPDHGEGFCLINDVAIAICALQREGTVRRAAVVDLDVHHGNGTAAIFRDDAHVFTFSMHQERNYPAWKPPSDLDIGLEDRTGDAEYLGLLETQLPELLARHRPDLVFYLAGADPYRFDQLGGLGLTIDGLRRRDELVFERARGAGAAVAVCLAGGYALRTDDTVEIHCNTVRVAREARARRGTLERRPYDVLKEAIVKRRQVLAVYRGLPREFCPHVLGTKDGKAHCLGYQFAGISTSGPIGPDSTDAWRCFVVDELSAVSARDGPWFSAANWDRRQTCVDWIDVAVDE